MKSCQIGDITIILLLNALALDLACVPVGTIVTVGADVVEGAVMLPEDPADDLVDDGVEETAIDEAGCDVEPWDPDVSLSVDDCAPPWPVALELVLVPEEILELDDRVDVCTEEDDDNDDWLRDTLAPVVKGILVLPVGTVLFCDGRPEMLPDPTPKRVEVVNDGLEANADIPVPCREFEAPLLSLPDWVERVLEEPPVGPPDRLDEIEE